MVFVGIDQLLIIFLKDLATAIFFNYASGDIPFVLHNFIPPSHRTLVLSGLEGSKLISNHSGGTISNSMFYFTGSSSNFSLRSFFFFFLFFFYNGVNFRFSTFDILYNSSSGSGVNRYLIYFGTSSGSYSLMCVLCLCS
jgi:hypothetical protein